MPAFRKHNGRLFGANQSGSSDGNGRLGDQNPNIFAQFYLRTICTCTMVIHVQTVGRYKSLKNKKTAKIESRKLVLLSSNGNCVYVCD